MTVRSVIGASVLLGVLVTSCNLMLDKTPLETIEWENDGNGSLQYKTNDTRRLSLATYHNADTAILSPAGTLAFQFSKQNGAYTAPYGVLFGYQDGNNFYRVLVLPDTGEYRVDKKVNGMYTTLIGWTKDYSFYVDLLGRGRTINLLVSEPTSGNYSLRFSASPSNSFSVSDSSLPDTGSAGFYVITGDATTENFPFDPVDVRFKITAPVVVP